MIEMLIVLLYKSAVAERFNGNSTVRVDFESARRLDQYAASIIDNWAERIASQAFLKQGFVVYHQVHVGTSVIDFLIANEYSYEFLAEVTGRSALFVKFSPQKKKQIENMKASGMPFYVYSEDHIREMRETYNIPDRNR